jgi:hypothetical protein
MKNIILFLVSIFFFVGISKAQDLIYKKDKSVLVVKVIEIGVDEIKYKMYSDLEGITFAVDKNDILKIKFESGKVELFWDYNNANNYSDNKKNALKIDFLSPLFGQTTIGYERSLKPGASMEFQLGIIGAGVNNYKYFGVESSGLFLRAGYKFITKPDFYLKGLRYAHVLKGGYIRPEITLGMCKEDLIYNYSSRLSSRGKVTTDVVFAAFMLNFGKQWIMNNSFLVDFFFGFGYGYKSNNQDFISRVNSDMTNYYFGNSHAFMGPFGDFPIALGGGLKIGYLIK